MWARLLALACISAALAFGQSEIASATLNGTVLDPSGASIPGAKVTVKSAATGLVRSTETSSAGLYSLNRIPVGSYELTIEAKGFKTAVRKDVPLTVGALVTVDVSLEIGATSDTLVLTAEIPLVETTRSTAATTVSSKNVSDLPVNGRNFIDFTTLTPGVVKDYTRSGDLTFGGQRGPMNSLLVDGADSNNLFYGQATGRTGFRPYSISQNAVEEFQVNSNSFPAEVGRAGGGVINLVTKSGTNDFHANAFWFFRDRAMNANTFVNNRDNRPRQAYHFNQFGGSAGGRIIRDKLFFFANYDGQRNTDNQIVSPNITPTGAALEALRPFLSPYTLTLDNNVYLAKVDWNASDKDRFSVRFNASRYNGQNRESNGLSSAREHTGDNRVNTNNWAAVYTRVLDSSKVLDFRFNYVADEQPGYANATGPEVQIVNGVTFGKNNFSPRYTNTYGYQPTGSLAWTKGRHTAKFGFDINVLKVENYFPGLFAGQYIFPSYQAFLDRAPSSFTQAFSGNGTDAPISHPNVNEYAFFAQDTYRVSRRLTLNYGVRYDFFQYNQPTTQNPDAGLAAAKLRTDTIPVDHSNIAPRFGFAYTLWNEKLVVRGGYGIYYARTPGLLLSTAILQNGIDVVNVTIAPDNALFPKYPNILSSPPGKGAPPNIYVTDPNFKTPRTQQFNLQLEQSLGRDLSLTAGYLGVTGTHLTRSRDINLFPSVLTSGYICPTSAACSATDGAATTFYRHPAGRPNANFGRITLFESGANSVYHGGFLQFTKRFSRNYQVLASYTLAKVIDSAPDATSVVALNSGDDAKVAQDTLAPNLERGRGQADIRHRFVISGVWDLSYADHAANLGARYLLGGWQLALIGVAQSGRPFNIGSTGDPNNDGNVSNDRPPFLGRNTYEGPGLATVDLRVTKDIPLYRERLRVKLIGEAFNLFNRANFDSIQKNLYVYSGGFFRPQSNFLLPQSNFDPRILQIAAKITF